MKTKRNITVKTIISLTLLGCLAGCLIERPNSLDYKWIYAQTLKADVNPVIAYLDTLGPGAAEDIEFKEKFLSRFKLRKNISGLPHTNDREVLALYHIFEAYWRKGMLDPDSNFDVDLKNGLARFFNSLNNNGILTDDSVTLENLNKVYDKFFEVKGLHNVEFGKTGKFYDLLVWKTETPEEQKVELIDTTATVKIFFMHDFVSLGWLEYARLGNYYPGGWATEEALYCVTKGYDLSSEKYLVNFLKHETQHFADRTRFPGLPAHKLEYRAKLLELHYGDKLLYDRLEKFIRSANPTDSSNAHPYANYNLVKIMSERIFNQDYVDDIKQWKQIPADAIKQLAKDIYIEDTGLLTSKFSKK